MTLHTPPGAAFQAWLLVQPRGCRWRTARKPLPALSSSVATSCHVVVDSPLRCLSSSRSLYGLLSGFGRWSRSVREAGLHWWLGVVTDWPLPVFRLFRRRHGGNYGDPGMCHCLVNTGYIAELLWLWLWLWLWAPESLNYSRYYSA